MKIMFYINTLQRGGAERVMSILASELAKRGHDCVLVTSFECVDKEYSLDNRVRRVNLEPKEAPAGFLKKNCQRVRGLRKLCKRVHPDVLVSFMPQPIIRSLAATVGLPVKNLISIRNDPAGYWRGFPLNLIAKALLRRTSWTVFQTDAARNYYSGKMHDRASVIPNPISEKFYGIEYNVESKIIVTCGRLSPQKNHRALIEAFALSKAEASGWRLEIYGEGAAFDGLAKLIERKGLHKSVTLRGATGDVSAVLAHAGIFVLSSDFEGLPNALMEAMAAGVPCISTDCPCGGPRSLIQDGESGLLVPLRNPNAMGAAINRLMGDTALRVRLGINAKAALRESSAQTVIDQWETLLEMLVSNSGSLLGGGGRRR